MIRKVYLIILFLFVACVLPAQSFFQITKAVANDRAEFDKAASSVSISGIYAIVGASFEDEDENDQNTLTDAGAVYIFRRNVSGIWYQTQKIVASDREANDLFGTSVSVFGDYLVVGAPLEDQNLTGSSFLNSAGSAYIFQKNSSGIWIEIQKIVASDRQANDEFANSVSISASQIIIGAPFHDYDINGLNYKSNAGASYILEKNSAGVWVENSKLVAVDRDVLDNFGYAVSISGNSAIIGAPGEDEDAAGMNQEFDAGSVYFFLKTSNWNQTQKICAPDRSEFDYFGSSVGIYNNNAIVGAFAEDEDASGGNTKNSSGSAYIVHNQSNWSVIKKIVATDRTANDFFGYSVHISSKYAVVGAYLEDENASGNQAQMNAGSAYVYAASSNWNQIQKINASDRTADDRYGFAVASDNNFILIGAHLEDHDASNQNTLSASGSAYINSYGFQINHFDTICNGDVFVYGNQYLTKAGTYRYMFQSSQGFDSLVYLRLHVNATYSKNITANICQGENILFGGQFLSVAGQYAHKYTSVKGCDSSVNLKLLVNPTYYEYSTTTLCNGKTLKFGKQTIANSGTYVETFSSYFGCDSTVELSVTLKPVYNFNIVENICFGDFYKLGNQTLIETGHYTEVFKTFFGCDSSINLSLNVSPKIDTSVSRSGSQLSSNNSNANYQWIDCTKGNTPVSGATNKSFQPVKNGVYAVIVSQYNCSDSSSCYQVNSIDVAEQLNRQIKIFPNPANNIIVVETSHLPVIKIQIQSTLGQVMFNMNSNIKSKTTIDISHFPSGIYFIQIENGKGTRVFSFVKE